MNQTEKNAPDQNSPEKQKKPPQDPITATSEKNQWESVEINELLQLLDMRSPSVLGLFRRQVALMPLDKINAYFDDIDHRLIMVNGALLPAQRRLINLLAHKEKWGMEAIEILIQLGADLKIRELEEDSALIIATAGPQERIDLMMLLIDAGAGVNDKGINGYTALMIAAGKGHVTTAELLLNSGADVNVIDNFGNTVFHYCIMNTFEGAKNTMVDLLMAHGASLTIKNKRGETVVDLAKRLYREDPHRYKEIHLHVEGLLLADQEKQILEKTITSINVDHSFKEVAGCAVDNERVNERVNGKVEVSKNPNRL